MLNSFNNENTRNFVELCKEAGYPTDLGGYYLRQLLTSGYLLKGDRGEYILSPEGRRYLAGNHQSGFVARLHVMIVASFEDQIVLLKRDQQPFLSRYEWPATAVKGGETRDIALQRLLDERLAPTIKTEYVGMFRRIDRYKDDLFDDKLFLVHKVELNQSPIEKVVNGTNVCIHTNEFESLQSKSRSLSDIYIFCRGQEQYKEKTYQLTQIDFEPSI